MPENKQGKFLAAPFNGVDELTSPKMLGDSSLSAASNVIGRGGRLAPRPGYVSADDSLFVLGFGVILDQVLDILVGFDTSSGTAADHRMIEVLNGVSWKVSTLDGATVADVTGDDDIQGFTTTCFTIDETNKKIYLYNSTLEKVLRYDYALGTGATVTCVFSNKVELHSSSTPIWDMCLDPSGLDTLFFTQTGGGGQAVRTITACRTTSGTVADLGTPVTHALIGDDPRGIVADGTNLYIVSGTQCWKCAYDGSSLASIVSGIYGQPFGIDIDVSGSRIYVVDAGRGVIWRSSLTGTNTTPIQSSVALTGGWRIKRVVSDGSTFLYWTVKNDLGVAPWAGDILRIELPSTADQGMQVISMYVMERSISNIPTANAIDTDDIILLQLYDPSTEEGELVVWFPNRGVRYNLQPGFTAATGTHPDIFVQLDRDVDLASSEPIFKGNGRASFAWMGPPYNASQGGVMICAGPQDGGRDNPYVFGFRDPFKQNTVQRVEILGFPGFGGVGNGNWTLNHGDFSSAVTGLEPDESAEDLETAINAKLAAGKEVSVTGPNGGPYEVEFKGDDYKGVNVALMTTTNTFFGDTVGREGVTICLVREGEDFANGLIYLRPSNLPRPTLGNNTGIERLAVQTVTILDDSSNAISGGSFSFNYGNSFSVAVNWSGTDATFAANFKTQLQALPDIGATNGVEVSLNHTGDVYQFIIFFTEVTAPVLEINTIDTSGLTGPGSPYPDGTFSTLVSEGGDLDGVYGWRAAFYSSLWNIEGAPSLETDASIGSFQNNNRLINWTVPSTNYFSVSGSIGGGPYIDYIRLYRRKYGLNGFASRNPPVANDPTGAKSNWEFVAQVPIRNTGDGSTAGTYNDHVSDAEIDGQNRLPTENEYPPSNANFVTTHNEQALFASRDPGDNNIWVSLTRKEGGISAGQLGFEYVPNNSYIEMAPFKPTDAPFTGIREFDGRLIVGLHDRVVVGEISAGFTDVNFIKLPGVFGMASHWSVSETPAIEDQPPLLFWNDRNGWVYVFDGINSRRVNRRLVDFVTTLVKRFWPPNENESQLLLESWYYCASIYDPIRNLLLFSCVLDDSDSSFPLRVMVHDIDSSGWYIWDMPARSLAIAREWSTTHGGAGDDVLLFGSGEGPYVMRVKDGLADNGNSFSWSYVFGKLRSMVFKQIRTFNVMLDFDLRSFGGAASSVGVACTWDQAAKAVTESEKSPDSETGQVVFSPQQRGKYVEVTVSGSQADNQTHPELVVAGVDLDDAGRRREA